MPSGVYVRTEKHLAMLRETICKRNKLPKTQKQLEVLSRGREIGHKLAKTKAQQEAFDKIKGHSMKEENHPGWKGDEAGYGAIHEWLKSYFGKPRFCEHCGSKTAKKYEWANISKKHKRDRTDWLRLCTSCHRKYDESAKKMWRTRRIKLSFRNGTTPENHVLKERDRRRARR